jgi:Nif-specific regulatory protein
MTPHAQTDRINQGTLGPGCLPQLIYHSIHSENLAEFFDSAVTSINAVTQTSTTLIMQGVKGQWRTLAIAGSESPPNELLAEALDAHQCQTSGDWIAGPVVDSASDEQDRDILLVQRSAESLTSQTSPAAPNQPTPCNQDLIQPADRRTAEAFDSIAAAVHLAVINHRRHTIHQRRSDRLQTILEMTAQWNQSRETDQLLIKIAEASTRLLRAERATIFLPEANGQMLIGKPALGVEDGTLRIPASAGVVGQVLKSAQPVRVDEDISDEQKQINRDIDQQLGFQTRTLVCVPLLGTDKKVIGAFEVINRTHGNFTDDDEVALTELAAHAAVAIETTRHVEKLATSKSHIADQAAGSVELIGNCDLIKKLKQTLAKIANTDLAILITGENGTGKEVVAQLIHYLSDRRDEVLVAVNCAAISETLLESELFGHEKGAFTDAHQAREGKFELANGGTLFLDEIGDMSLGGQAKLLRVLEEKIVVRVGGSVPIPTSARVVAATNQNLGELVRDKKFREDLFFRLNVVTIELPPLRERGDDVLLLATHFLDGFCKKARREPPTISAAAKNLLLGHRWPGNVRELRNMMERLAYLSDGDKVLPEDLAFINAPAVEDSAIPLSMTLNEATQSFQMDFIQRQIDHAQGNVTDAAANMGLHRSNLYRKMKQLGMNAEP